MNRRTFLRVGARAIVSVAAVRALPLEQLQRFVPGEQLRDEVALIYLHRAFYKYCELGGTVPALITAGADVFDMAEAELIRRRQIVYSFPGIPGSIMFKGVPMIRDRQQRWIVRMSAADELHPFRRDDSSF
jgi:hypothetical protein